MNQLEYFHKQLDLLTGLMDISDERAFQLIKDHKHTDLGLPVGQHFGNQYEEFSNLISTSVLIMGLSHFEDFLSKCIAVILTMHPDRNDLRVSLKVIEEKGKQLIPYLAGEQGKRMPFSEKITFIERNLPGLNAKLLTEIKFIYNIRNCIMHNNGIADPTLNSKYNLHQTILLKPEEVNGYGLLVRQSAKDVWDIMCQLYGLNVNSGSPAL